VTGGAVWVARLIHGVGEQPRLKDNLEVRDALKSEAKSMFLRDILGLAHCAMEEMIVRRW